MVSRIVCLTMLVAVANAATFMGYLPQKPLELAHKEGCYIKEINDVIPYGAEYTPIGHCKRIECTRTMIYYATCGKIGNTDPNCYITHVNYNQPYPECCPDLKCDFDNNLI
ncbi:uncharacterized protein LOC113239685 [Hyposmocoma kahamanoa]|uniref:uncharacterized protein LOC113239685 n=1 Tax=Hyposmocoma kahamanoa TaxID=1477025 RepID=UPI000E6D9EA0|nr:uncharacterized protein LOC113239685 [Hyposmocoma kahamanoa]